MMKRRKALLLPMILALSTGVILSSCSERETSSSPITSSSVVQGYKVTFDSDGGTAVESQVVEKGGKATRPADPTKAGYTFVGWFLNDEGWSFIGFAVAEDITLTARWSLNTYTITYHLNGLDESIENPSTYTVEDQVTFEIPTIPVIIEEDGAFYKSQPFGGWYLDSGFTRPISGITPGMTGNIDVYAKINTGSSGTKLEDYVNDGGRFEDVDEASYSVYDNAKYLGTADNPYLVLVKADSTSITSVNIHENCRFICSYAFYNCTSLTSITIPEGVTNIGDDAFRGCTKLTSITIPDSVTGIGYRAFYGCTGLAYNLYGNAKYLGNANNPYLVLVKATSTSITSVTIHENCRFIHSNAFYSCTGLASVFYKGTQEEWNDIIIGSKNEKMTNATLYYYSENDPSTAEGMDSSLNYWHDVDGVPTPWGN